MAESSISKFEVGDLVSITYLTEEEGGAIPRLITKINAPNGTTSTGKKRSSSEWPKWTSYNLTPWNLGCRFEYERNLKLVLAKNLYRVRCL
jgi:hypothetical protein